MNLTYTVTSKRKLASLIEEGFVTEKGITSERHFKNWNARFPKPSDLFALVVGNLELSESLFTTSSNKNIKLQIFTEIGNKHLTLHAMKSLKKAMAWDEENYGLEYDLKVFMIVAVSHFNMGAMENKGLNIFNSKFVLADYQTATDIDLGNIESIVALSMLGSEMLIVIHSVQPHPSVIMHV